VIHRFYIVLEIEGAADDAAHVLETLLDNGVMQDAINDHACDVGSLRVKSAICRINPDLSAPAWEPPS